MSFQAYIDNNIKTKTGKSPDDFKKLAENKGFIIDGNLNPKTKATEITNWLKTDFYQKTAMLWPFLQHLKGKKD